jgi:hypothetical protein
VQQYMTQQAHQLTNHLLDIATPAHWQLYTCASLSSRKSCLASTMVNLQTLTQFEGAVPPGPAELIFYHSYIPHPGMQMAVTANFAGTPCPPVFMRLLASCSPSAPRAPMRASISSRKMVEGAWWRAKSNST